MIAKDNTLNLPKIKGLKIKLHRHFQGNIKAVTLIKTLSNKYYAGILVENNLMPPPLAEIKKEQTIGIDLGLNHYVITSEGDKLANPKCLKKASKHLLSIKKYALEKTIKTSLTTTQNSPSESPKYTKK